MEDVRCSGNFYDVLANGFADDPDKPCFIGPKNTVSYGALDRGVGRMASLLIDKGVAPGDRVAAQTAKTPQAVMLYLATLKVGAAFLPLNTAYTEPEVRYFVEDAEPRMLVTDAEALAVEATAFAPLARTVPRLGDDLAAIVYTSGTTGRSKGAMLSHANLASNALALHAVWGFQSEDVLLHALPIFHIHGLFIALHTALLSGSSMMWLAKYEDQPVLDALEHSTVMMGVPTFYHRLLANPAFTRDSAAHVRLFISGSAPLLESTFDAFEARCGHRILERYGMSEAGIICTNPLKGERLPGSVGFPLADTELRIAGGETGEIEIKGSGVFSGYWRMPQKTREEFTADGFFKTGDVGRQDAHGRVWISGRAKDLIISGGYNVYPKEVEMLLDDLPGVAESAVIGVPHADFGEAVVAVVIGKGSEAALIAQVREHLAAFKAPKRIFFVEDLPRNAMGKVQKNLLRERYADCF
jgi:malonyl-CoA/methylmalonyl-CoA synthetase